MEEENKKQSANKKKSPNIEADIKKLGEQDTKEEDISPNEISLRKEEDAAEEEYEEGLIAVAKDDPSIIEKEIRLLISNGHMFKAHAIAQKAFEKYPDEIKIRQAYALILLKTGAIIDARKIIYPLLNLEYVDYEDADSLNVIDIKAIRESNFLKNAEADILADLANIFKESWNYSKSCQDLDIAKELYFASFSKNKDPASGMQAAWLFWLTGIDDIANSLSEEVLKLLPPLGLSKSFKELVILAEAQLLLNREDDACRLYEEAMKCVENGKYIDIVNERQHLNFLKSAGFKVPEKALEALIPPTIVVFTGYAIDHPSFKTSLFPQEAEEKVKLAIKEKLNEINARIGYSSASCGADLLFIEAMLERGGEVNIVLPFAISDFLEANVRHAGPRWEKRFEMALQNAKSVSLATEDRYLGHDMLYRFSNNVMHGAAVMRGNFLTSEPHLMAVWHSKSISSPGGPSDFIDRWSDISTLHLIDLDEITTTGNIIEANNIKKIVPGYMDFDPFIEKVPDRVIKSMMFSDLHGYSKLQDEHIPAFLDFLNRLHEAIDKIGVPIESINTWGDAVFAVADEAKVIAEFGLKYCDIIEHLGRSYTCFPFPIRARISLHSGPVFIANDPFINKINFYGGHINRAARLEPVTTVGQVYATQQFVSVLHTEISNEDHESKQMGLKYYNRFATEYVGVISLAKSYGQQEVYHLRWNN